MEFRPNRHDTAFLVTGVDDLDIRAFLSRGSAQEEVKKKETFINDGNRLARQFSLAAKFTGALVAVCAISSIVLFLGRPYNIGNFLWLTFLVSAFLLTALFGLLSYLSDKAKDRIYGILLPQEDCIPIYRHDPSKSGPIMPALDLINSESRDGVFRIHDHEPKEALDLVVSSIEQQITDSVNSHSQRFDQVLKEKRALEAEKINRDIESVMSKMDKES